ncbi:putative exportin-T [Blattamonas nauphoetae]|uniref:Exportin-T n=1 Tax=Blattamonas nauphoetae TaxID=2049346 RepID=A0ABQ9YE82_9EUKA|nr:putative exportin-T [Blattamonas nauphoetae]
MQQLEHAILTAFNVNLPNQERDNALDTARQFTMTSSCLTEVRFWSIGRITELLEKFYTQLSQDDLSFLRQNAPAWIQQPQAKQEESFIRRKFGQMYSILIKKEYPKMWPTAFTDLLKTLESGGETELGFFIEILKAVDHNIIHIPTQPNSDQTVAIREFKDNIKSDCLQTIVVTWYNFLQSTFSEYPRIADSIMSMVIPYTTWVDLDLIASKQFLTLMYLILNPPFGLTQVTIFHDEPVPAKIGGIPTGVYKLSMTSPDKTLTSFLSPQVLFQEIGGPPVMSEEWMVTAEPLRCKVLHFLKTIIRRGSSPYAKLQLITAMDIPGIVSLFGKATSNRFNFPSIDAADPALAAHTSPFANSSSLSDGEFTNDLRLATAQLLAETGSQIISSYAFLMSHGYTSLRSPFSQENNEETVITDPAQIQLMVDGSLIVLSDWIQNFVFWFDHDDEQLALALQPAFLDLLTFFRNAASSSPFPSPSSSPPPQLQPINRPSQLTATPLHYSSPHLQPILSLLPSLLTLVTSKLAYPSDLASSIALSQLAQFPPNSVSPMEQEDFIDAKGAVQQKQEHFLAWRSEIVRIFFAICRVDKETVQNHLSERMQQALALLDECSTAHSTHVQQTDDDGNFQRCDCLAAVPAVELALYLFQQSSSLFTSDFENPNSFITNAFQTLLSRPFTLFPSPLVATAFISLLNKYSQLPLRQPPLIQPLFQFLLSKSGLHNPNIVVSSSASAFLARFTKLALPARQHSTRTVQINPQAQERHRQKVESMEPLISPLLQSVIGLLQNASIETDSDIERLHNLFVTSGLLLSSANPVQFDVNGVFSQIIATPLRLIDSINTPNSPIGSSLSPITLLAFALNSLSAICKEINQSPSVREAVKGSMLSVAQSVVRIVTSTTSNQLRYNSIVFLRNVRDMLDTNAGDALRAVVPALLFAEYTDTDPNYRPAVIFSEVLRLVQHYSFRYREDLRDCLVAIFPVIVETIVSSLHKPVVEQKARMDTVLAELNDSNVTVALSEEEREHNQLLRTFIDLFVSLVETPEPLETFILQPSLTNTIKPTLTALTFGFTLPDMPVRASLLTTFTKLAQSAEFLANEEFTSLFTSTIHPAALLSLITPPSSQTDPLARKMTELMTVLHFTALNTIAGFGDYVAHQFLPTLHLSEQQIQMVLLANQEQNQSVLCEFYYVFVPKG